MRISVLSTIPSAPCDVLGQVSIVYLRAGLYWRSDVGRNTPLHRFQKAKPGSTLYDQGMTRVQTGRLVPEFEADIKAGTLPSVSWLVAPANQSEHASNHPAAGEDLTARLLKVLQQNPTVYAKTAFIINYDEGGQFFDHMWTPVPPATAADGESTVEVDGELIKTATEGVAAGSKAVRPNTFAVRS